jgi:hypothetical protein
MSTIGDIMTIGPHRLYLGDAYAIRPTLGWMDGDVMDPPFLFNAKGAGNMRKARVATRMIVAEQLDKGFDNRIINPLLCGAVVVFCHNDQIPEVSAHLKGSFHRFIMGGWSKNNPMPVANKHHLYDTDYYFHAWSRGFEPQGSIAQKRRFVPAPVAPAKTYNHGTVKPDTVMDKIITNVAGASVCDPFMGTGSTGVAAIKAGRIFTGIEHNPDHFATAVGRITQAYEAALATA